MGRSLPASIPCQICGDKSYGRHYGLWTCDGCSCFFKRSVRRSITYTCISGDNKCPVDKTRRNWCPACRLRKCFEMQMNRNAVQKERGPRKRRCSSESIKTHTSSENLNEKDILLSKAIQKASESSVVMFLAQSQKCEILERFWAMFLAIYAAEQGNIVFNNEKEPRSEIFCSCPPVFVSHSCSSRYCINDLISFPNPEASVQKLDSEEVRLLSCLLFCKIGHQMESLKFAASLYDTYCFWLVRHCTVYYPTDPARAFRLCGFLQKILLCVEDFSSIHTEFSISPVTIISQLIGK